LTVLFILGATACQNDELQSSEDLNSLTPMDAYVDASGLKSTISQLAITSEFLDEINEGLAMDGQNYRAVMAEYMTAAGSGELGQTVWAKNVGNKQLGADLVPNDPRGWWNDPLGDANIITYAIDQTGDAVPFFGGLTAAETTAAIVSATDTWDDVKYSDLGLLYLPTTPVQDLGYAGGAPDIFADIKHAGWGFILGSGVLGVTITFIWVNAGVPTDIDNNGKSDVAFREIYYAFDFTWTNDDDPGIDVEIVAVHELGHGLSQAHFGKVFTKKNGDLKVLPRAVMNALYTGP